MKISNLLIVIVCLSFIITGWRIYREHFVFKGEEEVVVLAKLIESSKIINTHANRLEFNPRLLASVIYAERRVNVNLTDSFEHIYANLGHDTSIGLAQIKTSTAKWIITAVTDLKSRYNLDRKYHKWLPGYESNKGLLKLLREDSTNCLLAAFHIKQILERWNGAGFDISRRPDVLMTLYSYGLFRREDGREILPHAAPRINFLGEVALSFYNSGKLRGEFP